ncbi:MAG TPA: DMT family transporter [Dehalococcoidia bacterium]|nr:DMT family transporter [Dehalococcoidia bacterium]
MSRPEAAAATAGPGRLVARLLILGQLLLVTAIWGGGFITAKIASGAFPPISAALMRTLIATVIFVPLVWGPARYRPRLSRRDWIVFAGLSILGYSALNIVYFIAFRYTNVTQASLIWGAGPLVTAVLAALLIGEALTRWVVIGVAATTLGVAAVVLGGDTGAQPGANPALGNLLIGIDLIMWVLYSIGAKLVMRRFSPLVVTGASCSIGAATLLPIALLTDWDWTVLGQAPPAAWLAIIYSGTISLVISYVLWIDGVRKIGATRVAVFTNLAPVWGVLFAALLLGEQIRPLHLAGGALILAGVWLANRHAVSHPQARDLTPARSRV